MARKRSARAIEKEQEELYSRLRSYGEDEGRRRWREAEERRAFFGPGRHHLIEHFQKTMDDVKPERARWLRENLGEREAEFRLGVALEISKITDWGKRWPQDYTPSPEQMKEIKLHQAFLDRPVTPEYNAMKFEEFKKTHVKRSR